MFLTLRVRSIGPQFLKEFEMRFSHKKKAIVACCVTGYYHRKICFDYMYVKWNPRILLVLYKVHKSSFHLIPGLIGSNFAVLNLFSSKLLTYLHLYIRNQINEMLGENY